MFHIGKKGDMSTELHVKMVDLLLIGVFILMVIQFVGSIEDNTMAHKEYISKDFALLLNSIYAAPTTVESFSYSPANVDMSVFDIDLSKGRVTVTDAGEDTGAIYYPYARDSHMRMKGETEFHGAGNVYLTKKGDTLTLRSDRADASGGICTGIADKGPSISSRNVFLHPSEGMEPARLWAQAKVDDRKLMWDFAEEMKRSEFRKVKSKDGNVRIVDSTTTGSQVRLSPDLLITMYPNEAQPPTEPFTISYVSDDASQEARRLACIMQQTLASDSYLSGRYRTEFNLRSLHPADLPTEHPYHLFTTQKPPTVIVEWGNVATHKGLYDDPAPVLTGISDAVETYYSSK